MGGRTMDERGAHTETALRRQRRRGLAADLVVGIVFSIILALLVALAGNAMTPSPVPAVITITFPIVDEEPTDLDPRDPLVMCTVFVDHTKCAREPS
jgi:hypothetical protein